jgi:hypothetical protein
MKTNFTLKKFFLRGLPITLVAAFIFFFGCYEFKVVDQPAEAYSDSSFNVNIIMGRDNDAGNDFTIGADLIDTGLVGILLPVGWTVKDSIYYEIHAADSSLDMYGVWQHATDDFSSQGYIVHDAIQTQTLTDSADVVPEGYYWWGGKTLGDLRYLDSIFFTITIHTDAKTGPFYLQYAVGDEDYWGRNPYDPECITDPLAIDIVVNPNTGVNSFAEKDNVSVYPNPTHGLLYIELSNYNNPVDLMIYDSYGRTVVKHLLQSEKNSYDLSKLAPGAYFVRLQSGSNVMSKEILLY